MQTGQKLGLPDIVWYELDRAYFSGNQCWDELRQFVIVSIKIVFNIEVKYMLQRSFCTCSKSNFSWIHCRGNVFISTLQVFINSRANSVPLLTQVFVGLLFFCDYCQKFTARFLRFCCSHSPCIYGFIKWTLKN